MGSKDNTNKEKLYLELNPEASFMFNPAASTAATRGTIWSSSFIYNNKGAPASTGNLAEYLKKIKTSNQGVIPNSFNLNNRENEARGIFRKPGRYNGTTYLNSLKNVYIEENYYDENLDAVRSGYTIYKSNEQIDKDQEYLYNNEREEVLNFHGVIDEFDDEFE